MPKTTKKAIREALLAVRREHAGRIQDVLGYRMYWQKLMKPRGVPGYAWNPIIVIEKFVHIDGRADGPFNWSGTLDNAVDVLHDRLAH